MSKTLLAHLAVLCTNLFFAVNYSLVKVLAPEPINPFALNVLRVAGCGLLFWAAWAFSGKSAGIRRADLPRFILCALTGVAINQTLFIKGITLTSTIHASLLILITPLLVTLFAVRTLREPFTKVRAAGLLLGIGGAAFLVLQREAGPSAPDYLLGDLLIAINAASYAVYFVAVRPLMQVYGPVHVIRWIFTLGLPMVLPFGWSEVAALDPSLLTTAHWTALASVVLTGSFLAYLFNAYGLQHIGAGATGAYIYSQPVFAVLIALLFLGERLTGAKVMAALLIFSGLYLISMRKTPAQNT